MPDSAVYNVVLRLRSEGELAANLSTVSARAQAVDGHLRAATHSGKSLGEALALAGEKIGGALEMVADKAMAITARFAKWGAVAAIGAATYGVAGLNNELEQTTISLGAIAQAQGFAGTFEKGFQLATDQIAKMKQDVKSLPGDLGQLSNIMKMIATPAAMGGASMDQIRQLSGRTMLTATILGVQQDIAAREMAALLSGRAGSHNTFGSRLGFIGDQAKTLNAASPQKRLAMINAEMAKYQGATDKFGQSFVAQWTTLKDNIKYTLLAPVTSPLFEHVKHTIADINKYFDEHKEKIHTIVALVGDKLASGWDKIISLVERIAPRLEAAADAVARMDPGELIGKFSRLLQIFVELKTTGALIRIGGGVASAIAAPHRERGGGGFGGVGGAGSLLRMSGGLLANPVGAGVAGAALGAVAASAYGAANGLRLLADESSGYHQSAVDNMKRTGSNLHALAPVVEEVSGAFKHFGDEVGSGFDVVMRKLSEKIALFFGHLPAPAIDHPLMQLSNSRVPDSPFAGRTPDDWMEPWKKLMQQDRARRTTKVDMRVHIDVSGNNDPSRVARLVATEIHKEAAKAVNRTSSPHVPRYDRPTSTPSS